MSEGSVGLRVEFGNLVEDRVVCDAQVAAEEVDENALWIGHYAGYVSEEK